MARAPATDRGRVEALLGAGYMLSKQERADILDIVARLEQRIEVLRAVEDTVDKGRIGVLREVYDRLNAVLDRADPPGDVGAYWIGAAVGVVLSMEHEEAHRG